jgi:thioredoxin reductase (NADPH)
LLHRPDPGPGAHGRAGQVAERRGEAGHGQAGAGGSQRRSRQALQRRFGADYQVVAAAAPTAALATLARLRGTGEQVALLLAEQWLQDVTGIELLCQAHQLHPAAKRVLLIPYGDVAAGVAGLQAMALGQLDDWLNTPVGPPELQLYLTLSELLGQWARATARAGSQPEWVRVVGPRWSPRSHELRDLLGRNNIAHGFYDAESEDGRRLLARAGLEPTDQPVVLLADGRVLVDPPTERLAQALGAKTQPPPGRYDVAVVGAGPAGLAAVTYSASEGLRTLLLEREAVGGQAGTTSLIRNYLGFPRGVSGAELAARATEQAVVFGAELVYTQPATGLRASGDDRVLHLANGSQAAARTVVIATGVSYRRLPVSGLDELLGAGVFYGAAVTEAKAMRGQRVFVVGGANSAGQAAVHLARHAEQVTLLVRGGSLAESMSAYLVQELQRAGNITVRLHTEVTGVHGAGRLEALTIHDRATKTTETMPAAALFILIGAEPHTDWLATTVERDERGFLLTGRDLLRDGRPPPGLAAGPATAAAGDQPAGGVRGRRRPPRLGQAGRLGRGRRRHRDPTRPLIPRRGAAGRPLTSRRAMAPLRHQRQINSDTLH